jgi:hypothetical protein
MANVKTTAGKRPVLPEKMKTAKGNIVHGMAEKINFAMNFELKNRNMNK